MENVGYVHNLIASAPLSNPAIHAHAPTLALMAFYRRHRRAILTINKFSGINTAAALFRASLPF